MEHYTVKISNSNLAENYGMGYGFTDVFFYICTYKNNYIWLDLWLLSRINSVANKWI